MESPLASLQIYVQDGGRTLLGRVLEAAGGALGPRLTRSLYEESVVLAGRDATRENVSRAIASLAERGFVFDVFSSVHGYPIRLADGPWLEVGKDAGLARCRLFYTTSSHGPSASRIG